MKCGQNTKICSNFSINSSHIPIYHQLLITLTPTPFIKPDLKLIINLRAPTVNNPENANINELTKTWEGPVMVVFPIMLHLIQCSVDRHRVYIQWSFNKGSFITELGLIMSNMFGEVCVLVLPKEPCSRCFIW